MPKGLQGFQKGHKDFISLEIRKKTGRKISKSKKGLKFTDKHKENISNAKKGKTYQKIGRQSLTNKIRQKISQKLKGRKFSLERIQNISKSRIGYVMPEEQKRKISKALKGKNIWTKGDKCHFWKGGISFEPYSVDWTKTLKRSIRERDKYTCQICKEPQGDVALSVHHIDYDKDNCNPNNLISLCRNCHGKTNHKRDYWKKYFLVK